jgi:hypothetical protein
MILVDLDFVNLRLSFRSVLRGRCRTLWMILILELGSFHSLNCFEICLLSFEFLFPFLQDWDIFIGLDQFYFVNHKNPEFLNLIQDFHIQISAVKDRISPF